MRLNNNPDTSKLFSSAIHGDPDTPLLRSYVGDTIVFRCLIEKSTNQSHVWTLSGHTFLTERYAGDANRKYSIHVGIAERYDLVKPRRAVSRACPEINIHFNGRSSQNSPRADGGSFGCWNKNSAWTSRCFRWETNPLGIPPGAEFRCVPADAPVKSFNVVSLDQPCLKLHPNAPDTIEVDFERKIEMTVTGRGRSCCANEEEATKVAGNVMPNPLTLRVNLGDCVKVKSEEQDGQEPGVFLRTGSGIRSEGILMGLNVGE